MLRDHVTQLGRKNVGPQPRANPKASGGAAWPGTVQRTVIANNIATSKPQLPGQLTTTANRNGGH